MFIDQAEIYVRSGTGGDGMVHFHREKYITRGGPDGGDGGRGGDVIFQVSHHLNTLATFRHQKKFIALNGGKGGTTNKTGRSSDALVIPVPPGTMIYNASTGELLADLVANDQQHVICKGGRGGRGNQHYATSRFQAPRIAERGEPGEEKTLRLELKLIADVGIVGVPNAGKSSFLAAVTNAKPKIANYPFTTLEPNLGVSELDEETSLVLADIPGLIEGAHMGVGLGFAFLRHVQRTRVLIHLLDGLSEDPLGDYDQINSEMALFDAALAQKSQIVALNKMDMPEVKERYPALKKAMKARGVELLAISALTKTDLTPILWQAHQLLLNAPPPPVAPETIPVYRPADDPKDFTIEKTEEGWVIHGAAIERAAAMTPWEHEGSVRRFQRLMDALGVDEALRKAGIDEGDTVFVGDSELEWNE